MSALSPEKIKCVINPFRGYFDGKVAECFEIVGVMDDGRRHVKTLPYERSDIADAIDHYWNMAEIGMERDSRITSISIVAVRRDQSITLLETER